jgi:putative Mg2+ transporter-C (MgtC) family protein
MTHETQIIIKLALAALFGASIGIERELKHKPMGLRTNVLIAMTGSLVMIMASEMTRLIGSDSNSAPRLAAAVIQGLGFLGAGTIIHVRSSVTGLTTAAVLLLVAGIGLATGAGAWVLAIAATAITLLVLTTFGTLERALHTKCQSVNYSLKTNDPVRLLVEINQVLDAHKVQLHGFEVKSDGDGQRIDFAVCNSADFASTLLKRALATGGDIPQGVIINRGEA